MLWILLSKKYQFLIVEVGLILARRANYMDCYKKSIAAKEGIRKYSKAFGGTLNDQECMKLLGITHNTYYKYKLELREEMNGQDE